MASWDWLSEPLPLDAANTFRWADGSNTEFLKTPRDADDWLSAVRNRLPRHRLELPSSFNEAGLRSFRQVRNVLLEVLRPLSHDDLPDPQDLCALGDVAVAHPVLRVLDAEGPVWVAAVNMPPCAQLLGLIAAEAVELLHAEPDHIAICHAPGCHWLFHQHRTNQRWCHPECGNRARVSRHYHRTRDT